MRDVDHTPPNGESVTNVWHRGRDAADLVNSADPADCSVSDD